MDYPFPLAGHSPTFEEDDLEYALGELLHMIRQAKWAGRWAQEYNPLLFYRCMHVIGQQPIAARLKCLGIIRRMDPHWMRAQPPELIRARAAQTSGAI